MSKKRKKELEEIVVEPRLVEPKIEDKECGVCLDDLNNGRPLKELKKVGNSCGHEFHQQCIDDWMKSGSSNAHRCPICRTDISEDQWPPRPISQLSINNSQTKLQQVIAYENSFQPPVPVPFLGIAICINGQMIIKYLNTDFGLGTNNTLNELKTAILSRSSQISSQRGFFCPSNLRRHLNNVVSLTGATTRRESSFRINRIGFGVPISCDFNFTQINYNEDALLLKDLYSNYQSRAEHLLYNRSDYARIDDSVFDNLKSVYKNHQVRNTLGRVTTNYFLNRYNPDIPEEFRVNQDPDEPYIEKATKNSLAWLIVDIECTTFAGGKTRKNKKQKKTKKKKSRFLKKKTYKKKY
jgi:hypothetical protein